MSQADCLAIKGHLERTLEVLRTTLECRCRQAAEEEERAAAAIAAVDRVLAGQEPVNVRPPASSSDDIKDDFADRTSATDKDVSSWRVAVKDFVVTLRQNDLGKQADQLKLLEDRGSLKRRKVLKVLSREEQLKRREKRVPQQVDEDTLDRQFTLDDEVQILQSLVEYLTALEKELGTDHKLEPLSEKQREAYNLIKDEGPLFGKEVVNKLGIPSQSTFTTHYVPALKKHGIRNKRGLGYYHPDTYQPE